MMQMQATAALVRGGHFGSPLRAASFVGSVPMVKLLLGRGADTSIQGADAETALQTACFEGHDEIVKLLLEVGAGPEVEDKQTL